MKSRLSKLRSIIPKYRTLCPSLIHSALQKIEFRIQMVLESERYQDYFHSRNLLSSDPPHWSCGPDGYLLTDPRNFRLQDLQEVTLSSFDRSDGWEVLHEFVFTLYPNKDSMGWEYNQNFSLADGWSDHPTPESAVRRRLWIRTCVRNNDLYLARMKLQEYLKSHPRGICKVGKIVRQSLIRNRWTNGSAVLTDKSLDLALENNYRSSYSFPLEGCEVVSLLYDEIENSYRGEQWHKSSSSGAQFNVQSHINSDYRYQFALRKLTASGGDLGLLCILCVSSQEEKDSWIAALGHQCALVNLIFWPFSFGPPIVDQVLAKGELWKKGHLVPTWKYRTFELRQNGTLAYFKGSELKGKIRLRGCSLQDEKTNDDEFTFSLRKKSGYTLSLRATDSQTKKLWKEAITSYIIGAATMLKEDSPLKGKLPKYSSNGQSQLNGRSPYSSIYDESMGKFVLPPDQFPSVVEIVEEVAQPPILEEMARESRISVISAVDTPSSTTVVEDPLIIQEATPTRGMSRRATVGPGIFVSDLKLSLPSDSLSHNEPSEFTHRVAVDKGTGRRFSVLNDAFRSHIEESGVWEAGSDDDPEDGDERDSRSSKIVIATHEIEIDKRTGRKKSILHEAFKEQIDESGVWEAEEDEDSDTESDRPTSSRLSSFHLSMQFDPVTTSHAKLFPSVEEGEEGEGEAPGARDAADIKTSSGGSGLSSVFGFFSSRK